MLYRWALVVTFPRYLRMTGVSTKIPGDVSSTEENAILPKYFTIAQFISGS